MRLRGLEALRLTGFEAKTLRGLDGWRRRGSAAHDLVLWVLSFSAPVSSQWIGALGIDFSVPEDELRVC